MPVIVPVCNVDRFRDQCLSSIEGGLFSLEIICFNNGSADGSFFIMRRHEAADGRYVVIDKGTRDAGSRATSVWNTCGGVGGYH